ncbi:MAG: HAD-IIA family hydrolase [Candidatus Methylomirabilia bacterium]
MNIRFPYSGWLFDLDGTVYRGEELIPGAQEVIRALRESGRRVVFLSNKPIQTREEYAKKLTRLGIPTEPGHVVNSSLVLARYLARHDPGASCFVIGELPLIAELRAHGLHVREAPDVGWVVIAFDRTFTYAKLNTALQAVRRGARLIATNPDRTCPTESGEIPDCAGMMAAVEAVTGAEVEVVAGKPSPLILEAALEVLALPAVACVIVGDRIETDIAMGRALGVGTILVLSGVTRPEDSRVGELPQDHVLRSVREILEP